MYTTADPADARLASGSGGFTLVELLVVIAIVAVLTSIAIPSYQSFIMKSRRADATGMLLVAAQRMQQYYNENDTYDAATITPADLGLSSTSSKEYYTLDIDTCSSGSGECYQLSAIPVSGKSQADDAKCATFTLTNSGVRDWTGSQTSPPCW